MYKRQGQEAPIQIVTGAWNVHVGDLVPVALHKSTPVSYTHLDVYKRQAMRRFKIADLRLIFENDVRFLEQF